MKMHSAIWPMMSLGQLGFYAALIFIAIFFGLASAVLPPQYLLVFGSIPLALFLAAAFPIFAFAMTLIIAFGLIPQFIFGSLSLGGAVLQPAELLLILTFCILIIRGAGLWPSALLPAKSLAIPFLLLMVGVAVGFFKGKMLSQFQYAGADFRQYVGWLALPVALWLNHRHPGSIHKIIMHIAVIAAIAMVFQLVSGVQVIYGFRGAEDLSKEFDDVKRGALGSGEIFLVYAAYYFFANFGNAKHFRTASFFGLILMLGGLAATFGRSLWGGFVVGWLIFFAITPSLTRGKFSMATITATSIIVLGLLFSLAVPRVGDAIVDRVLSVSKEGGRGSSVGFRFDENQQAWQTIAKSPLLGAGLGAEYKIVFRQSDVGGGFDTEASYVHNAYLGIWLKLGVLGIIFPIYLMYSLWRFQKKSNNLSKEINTSRCTSMQYSHAAFSSLICVSIYGLTSPVWSTFSSIAVTSCLIALICAKTTMDEH